MALVVEDGTGIAGATSYVTLAEARAYAAARGLTLPAAGTGDAALEQLLVRAVDWLEGQRRRYLGTKTFGPGYLQWPRTDVTLDGTDLAGIIPAELKAAQCQLAVELQSVDPMPTSSGPTVRQRTVGPLTTVYAVGDNAGVALPRMPKVEALLAPLCRVGGLVTVVRA